MHRSILLLVPFLALAACASATEPTSGLASDLTADVTVQEASKKLYAELFSDADTKESVAYTLLGHLPASSEACTIAITRNGLPPRTENAWSELAVHPLGASAASVEAHGPVDVGFATTPHQSSAVQALSADGTAYSETDAAHRKMELKLSFADGARSWSAVTGATIAGEDVAGKKAAACVEAKPLVVLRASEYGPVAQKAADAWAKDNDENLADEGIELEGCSVASATEIGCAFGNETNEETLDITFALTGGELGNVTNAERHSDFHD